MNRMQFALIKKDLGSVSANKNMLAVLLIVPFMFTVFVPSLFILLMHFAPGELGEMTSLLEALPALELTGNANVDMTGLLMNKLMPVFFMIIPLMASSVMAASSFVGEKEKRTLETLLYCPLTLKQIFQAKVFASFALSMLVSFASFVVMVVVTQVEMLLTTGVTVLPDVVWLITMLLLAPALSLTAISLIVRGSAKAKTMEESQQRSVFLIMPILLLIVGQFTGLLLLNVWVLLALGVLLAAVVPLFMRGAVKKMEYETLFE